jgi:hypothetical protein
MKRDGGGGQITVETHIIELGDARCRDHMGPVTMFIRSRCALDSFFLFSSHLVQFPFDFTKNIFELV